ncbi:transcriptional regulator, Crp/Fnr family [hydrothermal vent metagenome]|uniref:Transcriptional regulator, Crp/Fnr family n=1 Tax=hydrothermal vent metagenome TaxID=652676 RepID=A0A3B0XZL3_9ZZZZ
MNSFYDIRDKLKNLYPEVENLLAPVSQEILESGKQVRVPAGTRLYTEAEHCERFMWLLEGTVRVFKNSPEGREITLYRVRPGDVCVLSLQSLLCGEGFPAEATAESDLLGLSLTLSEFNRALDQSDDFRRYLLKILSQRIGNVMKLVSEVTFQRLDLRLACLMGQLFERSNGEPVKITHAQIARELGTTREMISRILKEFEHQNCIRLQRGEVHLISREGLSWFSQSSDPVSFKV